MSVRDTIPKDISHGSVSHYMYTVKASSQYDAGACVVLRHHRVDACRHARIDSDSILAFLCVALLRLVMKKSRNFEYFCVLQARRNATALHHIVNQP